jgi:tetratricopeptide (TPR) repeat protein
MTLGARILVFVFLIAPLLAGAAVAQSASLSARSQAAARAMSERRFDDAAAAYRELLTALPDDAGLLTNLGMALAMGGHEAEALAPLERAVALKPESTRRGRFSAPAIWRWVTPKKQSPR